MTATRPLSVPKRKAISSESRIRTLTGEARGTIPEVVHQRAFSPLSAKSSAVNFIIETRNASHATEVVTALRAAGFEVRLPPRGRRPRRLLAYWSFSPHRPEDTLMGGWAGKRAVAAD